MERKRNSWNIHEGFWGMIVSVILVGAAICILGVALISLLIGEQTIQPEAAGYGLVAILLLASFVVVRLIMKRRTGNKTVSAAMGAATVLGLLVLGNLILGAGNMKGIGQTVLVIMAGGACAMLLKTNPSRKKKYRGRRF